MRIILLTISLFLTCSLSAQNPEPKLQITPLTANFYIFTTWNLYQETRYPANGLYVVTDKGVIMIDSPWDTTQFQPLLDSIWKRHQQKVVFCIATHFHEDRTGGLEYYSKQGIATWTTKLTDSLSRVKGKPRAEHLLAADSTFDFRASTFEIYYPGPGHAPDNIVVWFPQQRVLYGGCLIKSTEDNTLGNLGDANQPEYAATVMKVIRHCPKPRYVIPGHSGWGSTRSLQHTYKMAKRLLRSE